MEGGGGRGQVSANTLVSPILFITQDQHLTNMESVTPVKPFSVSPKYGGKWGKFARLPVKVKFCAPKPLC